MGDVTNIEWTDHTWSPWEGCQKVGPGCEFCYAEVRNNRFGGGNWGPGAPRRMTAASGWLKPIRYNREAAEAGVTRRIFPSLCDPFDNAVDPEWRKLFASMIMKTPNLEWLLLTKRIGNVLDMLIEMFPDGVPANVRIGATIVNQDEANRDLRKVAAVMVATVLKPFLSMEPLLGRVDLASAHIAWHRFVGWVIIGGESGANARMMDPWAAMQLVEQCQHMQVPVLFKQWGEWGPVSGSHLAGDVISKQTDAFVTTGITMRRVGKVAAGRQIHGREYTEFPK